ncbi:MAG: cytochrome C oxidase subunit IV family protein [Deltaproteobacteria bacterium]|nr:cytochrome C oxidase subunit IV family protein [Deltaproteobacteria bacterium]
MNGKTSEGHTSAGTYAAVWLALLALLAATVAISRLQILARFSVLGSLAIASIKAALVLAFFMHLRYEGALLKGVLTVTVFALTMLIGLTFVDVWYR